MGEVNQILEKVKKKKWGKEEWIILILVGIFLLIVFWPASDNTDEKKSKAVSVTDSATGQEVKENSNTSYKEQMESQLEEILKSIDGIDNVNAMITFQTSEEEVILRESRHTQETTVEEDSQGGIREIESESVDETVCYGENQGESTGPYVTYTIAPKVEGVLVVVGGNKASSLRTQIVKAVQALFDVESHKVVVIKMKES